MTERHNKDFCRVCGTHEIYCCGSHVCLSKKGVDVLSEPVIDFCPLHAAMYGTERIDTQTVQNTVEKKIISFGFCCKQRRLEADAIVAYGASEMMSVWLEKGSVDCAVIVCDGAGTVISADGKLVQGIGARLTGIIKTSPIPEVIKRIERCGGLVLDKNNARIDQAEGVRHALNEGFKRVAVSVASSQAEVITEIRGFETTHTADVLVFSVCNTRATEADVKHISKADIVCASASSIIRKEIGSKALLQIGVAIPVYALTQKGKSMILAYLTQLKDRLVVFRTDRLPYEPEGKGPTLKKSLHSQRSDSSSRRSLC